MKSVLHLSVAEVKTSEDTYSNTELIDFKTNDFLFPEWNVVCSAISEYVGLRVDFWVHL